MDDFEIKQLRKEENITGPGQSRSANWDYNVWDATGKQAKEKNDPVAHAVLLAKKQIDDSRKILTDESTKVNKKFELYSRSLKRTDGILIAVFIAFIINSALVFSDLIKEKDLHLEYSKLY